ncbi:N-acetyltransferase [Lactobacillus sp.] [Lactiplantibacillus mudanjiangensis]|uniref:GNAT family N-acetyltransferase n=1 Tax=Lactiplantibacillus mudanjiangensis TaxID=1296538 RepID=UPI001014463A|nr:GNAT family N-acetyltransferase [Lactiplantibacillus mudanjiangensis]VDG17884.1 N-acetyltransferase [Lactobacillus sp.] [Lactiplantibacillus mudanjiangensis]VDG32416.1 N-acetyltransferase [Lactobacillus sp.] [Lactiplantibacillus mudanjiangensis]
MAADVVEIRPAEATDAAQLLALLKQLATESNTFTADDGLGELSEADERSQIEQITKTTTNIIMVAALGDELLGVGTVQATDDLVHDQGEVGVAVLKTYWGNGLGTALVEELLHWASDYSTLAQLCLTVQMRNQRAIKLYQHLGFQTVTTEPYAVIDPTGMSVQAIDMVLAV